MTNLTKATSAEGTNLPQYMSAPQAGTSSLPSGGLPPSATCSLWQVLMDILKYEKTVLDNNAKQQQNWAQNLGGTAGKNGIYQELYQIGINVGIHDAQSLIYDGIFKATQAGVSGLSLGATGLKAIQTNRQNGLAEGELKDANDLEGAIHNSQAGLSINEGELGKVQGPVTEQVQARIDSWKKGENIEKFNSSDATQAEINKKAAEAVANNPQEEKQVLKQVQKQKDSIRGKINSSEQQFDRSVQYLRMGSEALNNALGATGSILQAGALADKAKAQSGQTIVSQMQQQVATQENKSEQNAQDALQQANQWSSSIGSAMASQVQIRG